MKYLATIYKIENANDILNLADGLVVGLKDLSTRETSYLTTEELVLISKLAKKLNKELFISLKPMLFNEQTEKLVEIFKAIKDQYYTGVIVGDMGYYYLLKEYGIKNIVYHPETLLTNISDINDSFDAGFKGAFISKEIHIDDVKKIVAEAKGLLFINAHGYLNMFYSKRTLIKNYLIEIKKEYSYLNKETLRLKEHNREGYYPIVEDKYGTHIYRKNVSTMLYQKDEVSEIDYFLIDSIFHDDNYVIEILKLFKNKTDLSNVEQIKKQYSEDWDEGFLFTKTIYKRD